MVPESAVLYDATGNSVWRLLEDGTAQRVPVELGVRQAGRVEIVRGLAAGDRVVSAGVNKVAPGRPLQITNDAPATS
jgi:membrane fusion protein (multidrug efflux system)